MSRALTERLMKKLGGQQGEDDGGANLGGNAGLSQMGAIPSGNPLTMVSSNNNRSSSVRRGKVIECSECGFTTDVPTPICVECGNKMPKMAEESESSYTDRVKSYRQREAQFEDRSRRPTATSFEERAFDIMQFIKSQNPEMCENQDEQADKMLYNFVQSALFGFIGWKQCRKS